MRYLPSIFIGIVYLVLVFISFQLLANNNFILDAVLKADDLNENSFAYFLVALFDIFVYVFFGAVLLIAYNKWLKRFPFDWLSALLIQIPIAVLTLGRGIDILNLKSVYAVSSNFAELFACISVLLTFYFIKRLSQKEL